MKKLAALFLAFITLLSTTQSNVAQAETRNEYILRPMVNLRTEPCETSLKSGALPRNTSIIVLDENKGWIHALTPDGRQGWVREDLTSDAVIRIHWKEKRLTISGKKNSQTTMSLTSGNQERCTGRYFLLPQQHQLSITWPNREDLRKALRAGHMNYPAYRTAILAEPKKRKGTGLALCPAGSKLETCAVFIEKEDYINLKKAVPLGARVEIYEDLAEDLHLNGPDALSQAILKGALEQLDNPAIGMRTDARIPALPYPGGDIQPDFAAPADIVIRAARKGGTDLQALVHEDILTHPDRYEKLDLGNDYAASHRLLPVLQTYFRHNALSLPTDCKEAPYSFEAGDIVFISTETLDTKTPTLCGIVTEDFDARGLPMVITIGGMGQHTTRKALLSRMDRKVTGHFRMTHLFDYQ